MFRAWIGGTAALALVTVLAAGCGSAAPTGSAGGTSSSSSAAATSSASGTAAPVKTGTVTINNAKKTVLTTASGYTLYYFDSDSATKSACTGSCASLWPALTTSATTLTSASGLGAFTVVKDSHGQQVAYKGHLLYTYKGDTKPGEATGNGKFGLWWAASPGVKALASSGSGSASSSSSSGW